jgi:hypothetical protein
MTQRFRRVFFPFISLLWINPQLQPIQGKGNINAFKAKIEQIYYG